MNTGCKQLKDEYLSIVMPCYNGEEFVETAILSILAQPAEEIRLIIVDDGSTDGTAEIVKKYESERVTYIHIENGGAGHARNVGIKEARGKWISFIDSDDVYLIDSLTADFISKLKKFEEKGVEVIRTPRLICNMDLSIPLYYTPPEEKIKHHMPNEEFWSCVYNASFIKRNSITFYEYQKQDIESAFRYKVMSDAGSVVCCNDMAFCLYRANPESNTHTWNVHRMSNIKMKVYMDLYFTTKWNEDRNFLIKHIVRAFMNSCFFEGSGKQTEENAMIIKENHDLLKTFRKKSDSGPAIMYFIIYEILVRAIKGIKAKKSKNTEVPKKLQESSDSSYKAIKERLAAISEKAYAMGTGE